MAKYTSTDRETIVKLAVKGVSDVDIVMKTGFGIGFVGMVTTNFWKLKMKNKHKK